MIESHTRDDSFITLFYSEIDAPNRKLSYSSAGHPPALLIRGGSGEIEDLPNTGVALGIEPDFPYRMKEGIGLEPGDALFVYTDGLTESRNHEREMFGVERLKATLLAACGKSAAEMSAGVLEAVTRHCGGGRLQDDLTWVVVRMVES